MTLNQPSPWLSLNFPIWAMRWLGQLVSKASTVLMPALESQRILTLLKKDILLWPRYQERFSFLQYEARNSPFKTLELARKMVRSSLWKT